MLVLTWMGRTHTWAGGVGTGGCEGGIKNTVLSLFGTGTGVAGVGGGASLLPGSSMVTGPRGTVGCTERVDGWPLSLNGKEHSSNVMSRDRMIAQVLLFHNW